MSYIYELKIIGPARSDCGTNPNCAGCGLRALGPGESAPTTVESPLEPTTNEANAWLSRAIQVWNDPDLNYPFTKGLRRLGVRAPNWFDRALRRINKAAPESAIVITNASGFGTVYSAMCPANRQVIIDARPIAAQE